MSTANGNCLFDAVSIALSGGEALVATLRLLTVSELLGHCEFYAQHPQLVSMAQVSGYSVPALINILLSNEKAEKLYGESGSVSRAIEVLAKETAKLCVYSSQFHIMALASVIKKPIKVVYPVIPSTIRIKKALHCVLYPRDIFAASDLICIMWTRTNISSLHGWQPNHFVPLLNKAKRSNVRLSYADAVKTTTTGSSKLSSSNVSTSATTTRCHRTHYTEPKVQTKPNIGRKNSSAQASTSPLKDRTQMKSYQSATTATLDPIAPVQMKRRPTTNACTSREVRHDTDYRVKIQRKRRRSTNSKINANTSTTNTVNPISSYFLAKSHIKPSTDKTNEGNTGNNTETHENNTNTNKTNEIDTGDIKTNKENNCDNKNNEVNTGDKYETSEEEILPLAGPGFSWYKKKGKNAGANLIRSEIRMRNEVVMEDQDRKGLIRGSVNGTSAENVDCLIENLSRAGSDKKQEHLKAMISLAKYIMDNSMIVPTQDVAEKIQGTKRIKTM